MSTTFYVVPVRTIDITFGQVIATAEKRVRQYLNSIGVHQRFKLGAMIHDRKEAYVSEPANSDLFAWKTTEYAWFYIHDYPGGTDAYCEPLKGQWEGKDQWWPIDSIEQEHCPDIGNLMEKVEQAKELNLYWTFRRSVGQLALMNIVFGLISGAVAELTDGIVWSIDGAWDYRPAEHAAFFDFYFNPEKAIDNNNAKWADECIGGVQSEFGTYEMDEEDLKLKEIQDAENKRNLMGCYIGIGLLIIMILVAIFIKATH